MNEENFFRTPVWYPVLAGKTFLTSFVKLRPESVRALADGLAHAGDSPAAAAAIESLRQPLNAIPGNAFVSVDCCAATDTERYLNKHGAVFSPESAWRNLAESAKVRAAAAAGEVECLCIRPFRRMNQTREFRLFIVEGRLVAMSQYHLIRHFRRLEGVKEQYWDMARRFVDELAWMLPEKTLVMDIYITSDDHILIVDLNPWGKPTDPLLLRSWERDWQEVAGIVLMPPPTRISGDVNVSF